MNRKTDSSTALARRKQGKVGSRRSIIKQTGNMVLGGDLAGRDIDKSTKIIINPNPKTGCEFLQRMQDKYLRETLTPGSHRTIIEQLEHYTNFVKQERIRPIGLDAKLSAASHPAGDFAKLAKESFEKRLERDRFYESAQRIYAYTLSSVESRFANHITPLLASGQTAGQVLPIVQATIITEIQNEFGDNHLGITPTEINGMMYFLTGNCYIKWTA